MKNIARLLILFVLLATASTAIAEFAFGSPAFALNSAELDGQAKAILADAAEILKRYPEYKLKIVGSRGKLESDRSISKKRLKAARAFLIESGISRRRIILEDIGSSQPLLPNCHDYDASDDCDKYDRRITLQLIAP